MTWTSQICYIIEYVGDPSSIKEVNSIQSSFSISPNPCRNQFTIELSGATTIKDKTTIAIYNILGEKVQSEIITTTKQNFTTNDLTNGVYFIKIENTTVNYNSLKLIVKH